MLQNEEFKALVDAAIDSNEKANQVLADLYNNFKV